MKQFTGLLLSLVLLVTAASCGKQRESAESTLRTVSAHSALVKYMTTYDGRSFPGKVEAKNQISLASRISAYITSIRVNEGDHVSKGDILITVDDRDIKERINSLSATLVQIQREKESLSARLLYANAQFRRYSDLLKEQAATKQEFEKIKSERDAILKQIEAVTAREKSIRAQREQVKAILDYTRLKAPAPGTVTRRFVDLGTFVNAGQPLLIIEVPQKGYWFTAHVDEGLLRSVRQTPGVAILIPSAGLFFFTKSVTVVPDIDPESHTFIAKVDISALESKNNMKERINNGMYGRIIWFTGVKRKIVIPTNSVIKRGEIEGVYVVDKKKTIHFRVVKTGSTFSNVVLENKEALVPLDLTIRGKTSGPDKVLWVEILSGLQEGERIITSDLDQVSDGYILK